MARPSAHVGAVCRPARTPGDVLLRPVVIGAVALLVLNDHLMKQALPGVVTGKVSDVAGLVFFPLLLLALVEGARKVAGMRAWWVTPPVVAALVVATGVAFVMVKTSPAAAVAYSQALGLLEWPLRAVMAGFRGDASPAVVPVRVIADATDLLALPALALAYAIGVRTVCLTSQPERGPSGTRLARTSDIFR